MENEFLIKKIDSIETRLESHVSKIEQRLDQIVHIMQAVAALQEKESRNSDSIKELKEMLKVSVDKFDRSVTRIHERLDAFDDIHDNHDTKYAAKFQTLDEKINKTSEEVSKWMNRGIGIWLAISAVVIIIQSIGGFVLSSFKDDYQATKTQISEMTRRQNEIEQDITRLRNTINQQHK